MGRGGDNIQKMYQSNVAISYTENKGNEVKAITVIITCVKH